MKRQFAKLSGREQGLLLLLIWSALLYWGGSSLRQGSEKYKTYDRHADAIRGHNKILSERVNIEKRIRERLKSHDNSFSKGKLESVADKVARSIGKGSHYDPTKPRKLGELFSQHTVKITFERAQWEDLKQFVGKIRDFSPGMFLSEVEIKPHYRGLELDYYKAVFHVSSLELKKKRF